MHYHVQLKSTTPIFVIHVNLFVAKMTYHAIFQYNVLAIDDTHNTWTNVIVKDDYSQAFRFK